MIRDLSLPQKSQKNSTTTEHAYMQLHQLLHSKPKLGDRPEVHDAWRERHKLIVAEIQPAQVWARSEEGLWEHT